MFLREKKPTIRVYHAIPGHYDWEFNPRDFWPRCYKLVAEVETTDLQEAYYATNHTDMMWTLNPGVKARVPGQRWRSSSVGDILVTPDNRVFRVAGVGFTHLFSVE